MNSIINRKASDLHHLYHFIPKRNSFRLNFENEKTCIDQNRWWETDWQDHDQGNDVIEMLNPRNTYRGALFNDGKIIKIQSLCCGFKYFTRSGYGLATSCSILTLLNPIKQRPWIWYKLWKSQSFFGISNQNENYFWLG